MKTFYITNLGSPAYFEHLYNRSKELNQRLPEHIFEEKFFQLLFQLVLLGEREDCQGFFETAEGVGTSLPNDAPIGAGCIRIDYDANYSFGVTEDTPEHYHPDIFYNWLPELFKRPNNEELYPPDNGIDHVRVTFCVAPGKHITRTFWPNDTHQFLK